MDYVGHIIRPPSEAHSIILQATVGCSHNKCTFCGAYKEKTFGIKDSATIEADLEFAARYCQNQKKLFLADGDALIIPFPRLRKLFQDIRTRLPWVRRISLYGSARSIRSKTVAQLNELKSLGLDRVYLGLESGSDEILEVVKKGETGQSMIEAAQKIHDAELFLSVTVLLGIGGLKDSQDHAAKTARVLNQMHPRQTAALTLMVLENTELGIQVQSGQFILPDSRSMLLELRTLVENLELSGQFHANHASNYLPITGRLPRDKVKLLKMIDTALSGEAHLTPEALRRL